MNQFIVLVIIFLASSINAHERETLTLNTAVQKALEHRPNLEALSYATRAHKSTAKAALAKYYPVINFSTSFDQPKGNTYPLNTSTMSFNQLIYSFSGPLQEYRKAKQQAYVSEYDHEILKNRIRLEVEKAFLSSWLLQESKESIVALHNSANAVFKQAKHKNKIKLMDRNDWFKSIEEYANGTVLIEQFYDSLHLALSQLSFLMGTPPPLQHKKSKKPSVLCEPYLAAPIPQSLHLQPLKRYIDAALTHHPELKQRNAKIALERANIKLAQGLRLPTINASAMVQHVGVPTIVGESTQQGYHSVGIALHWSLFDGTVNHRQEEAANANRIKEILGKEQAALDIKQQIYERYFTLTKTVAQLMANKARYQRAHNEFMLRKKECSIGALARPEFEAAHTVWQQERVLWLAKKVDAVTQRQELLFACSYPPDLNTTVAAK